MHECSDCGRSFRYEVFEKHIKICVKVFTKKNRESSLSRKATFTANSNISGDTSPINGPNKLSQNDKNKLPPTQTKKSISMINENEGDAKNMKKPPLKR